METEHRHALPRGTRLGDYEIKSVLGSGGFGITYLALDVELGFKVAIKEYLPAEFATREQDRTVRAKTSQDTEGYQWGLERFLEEARALGRFRHPNIVRVLRFFKQNNTAYIVMDYEQGRSLGEALKEGERATTDELLRIVPMLLSGLKQVHGGGLLHRDIKPANVYLRDGDSSPVLLDFGAARYAVGSHTRSMSVIISAGYSPYEQYESRGNQGAWTDIYGMAGVLYRCIGGQQPVEAPARVTARLRGAADPLVPAVEIGKKNYPEGLLQAIDWGLAVLESERPQSVGEWEVAFKSDSVKPVIAEVVPEPSPVVVPKVAQDTNKVKDWLLGVVLCFLLVGGYWFSQNESPQPNTSQGNSSVAVPVEPASNTLIKNRYLDHGDGTITDTQTKLQWMRCLVGQNWRNGGCHGEARKMDWEEALKQQSNFAGYSDWRPPTSKELRSLVYCSSGKPAYFPNNGKGCDGDYQRPTLIQEAFPDAPSSVVWSGSPVSGYSADAWGVSFYNGDDNYGNRGNSRHVRLVRGGQ